MASKKRRPAGIVQIPLDALEPNPFNVRVNVNARDLRPLARSIKERGLIHPILVRPHPDPERFGQYQIICGERRYRAIKQLASKDPEAFGTVPARVEALDDTLALGAIMQENELREDWSPYEKAAFFRAVYEDEHFASIREMARNFDIGLTTLHRYLRVFDLPADIVARFRDGTLSIAQIEVILDADESIRGELAELLAAAPRNKAEARRLAARLANPAGNDWVEEALGALTATDTPANARPAGDDTIRIQFDAGSVKELKQTLAKLTRIAKTLGAG